MNIHAGINYIDSLYTGSLEYKGNSTVRALITHANGGAPAIIIPDNGRLANVVIGGQRGAPTEIQPSSNTIIEDCILFGYTEGINIAGGADGMGAMNVTIRNNVFVNCGDGHYSHPIYQNNSLAKIGQGAQIYNNIFVGCQGYSIHCWHDPTYNNIFRNFVARSYSGIAQNGNCNVFRDNIIWSNYLPNPPIPGFSCPSIYLDRGSNLKFNWNLFGLDTRPALLNHSSDAQIRNNGFVVGGIAVFGTSPQQYSVDYLKELLGYRKIRIDNFVNKLIAAFEKPNESIIVDPSIGFAIARLRSVIDAWALHKG